MEYIEILKQDIKDMQNAYQSILNALCDLEDVDGLDDEYKQLDLIAQSIDESINTLKVNLADLEEEAYYKENEQQWKKEQQEQDYQYWKSQI